MAKQVAVELHIRWMQVAKYSRSAIDRRQAVLDRLFEYTDIATERNLTRALLAQWRDRRRMVVGDATFRMECSHIQSWLDWSYERELIQSPLRALPMSEARILDTAPDEDRRQWLTDDRIGEIMSSLNGDRRGVLLLLAGTGLRRSEASALMVAWWDPEAQILHVPEYGNRRTKHHKRDIPVGTLLTALVEGFQLEKSRDGALMTGPAGGRLPNRANEWLKPHGCSSHDLRRWYSTTLLKAGCPCELRHAMLGHVPSRRDAAYARPDAEDMRPWAEKVDEALRGILAAQEAI